MGGGHGDYSGTPLHRKLGIAPGAAIAVVNEPDGFLDRFRPTLPPGVRLLARATEPLDVILYFSDARASVQRRLPVFARYIAPSGGLWVAYPKKASRVPTDLSFAVVQEIGLAAGLVDNKSCAVDESWTAVRFVYRLGDRPRAGGTRRGANR